MKAVAYSIKSSEKEPLAKANQKRHEITLISNALSIETATYAAGKEAVIVFDTDDVSAAVINKLAELGIRYIATRSVAVAHIDQDVAAVYGIRIASVPHQAAQGQDEESLPMLLATETILNLDKWQQGSCLGLACVCSRSCDRSKDQHPIANQKEHGH